jgi:glycosyltransferase involved in cell wall biosynthesis
MPHGAVKWKYLGYPVHQSRPVEISISVIVPAFNMELFIEECLRSLFEQTVDRLEVIVVDDGSTDRTRVVVESTTPPQGKSLRLISKPNGGLSSARNAGMRAAEGRWIGFVDADDWVTRTMYSVLLSEAESAGADLAIARNVSVDMASGAQRPSHDIARWNEFIASHGRRVNPLNCPDLFLLDHSPCKRIYNREFLERVRFAFADGLVFEDLISSFQLLCRANSVLLVDDVVYFYRVGHHGQITARKDHSLLDILPAFNLILDELWNYSASAELWANFIWFQAWLVLLVVPQIADAYREKLICGVAGIAQKFPPQGLRRFRQKFGHDTKLSTAVELMLYGNAALFADFARTGIASERAKRVVSSGVLQRLFIARAQVTSRLARISSLRKRPGMRHKPLILGRSTSAI